MLNLLRESTPSLGIPNWGVSLLGLAGLGFIAFSIIRHSRRLARAAEETPDSSPQRHWLWSRLRATRAGGLDSATQAVITQLEGKIARLESLITAADERIVELRRLASGPSPGAPGRSLSHAHRGRSQPGRPGAGGSGGGGGGGGGSGGVLVDGSDAPSRRICELADEGCSPQEIAEATGHSVSEINLVLALRG